MKPEPSVRIQLTQPRLMLQTSDVPLVINSIDRDILQVFTDRSVHVERMARVAFQHYGNHSGLVVLGAAVKAQATSAEGTEIQLRLLALFNKKQPECVEEFLTQRMGRDISSPIAFNEQTGGWLYKFEAMSAASKPAAAEPDSEKNRREPRASVRVALKIRVGFEDHVGEAYNVSTSGLFIILDTAQLKVGTMVQISYPVFWHGGHTDVAIKGRVCWEIESMTGGAGSGYGLIIEELDDGNNGDVWNAYVDREVAFGKLV